MTPDHIIVSVPHSGTRFLKERLGVKDHVHTTGYWSELVQLLENKKAIVPLRKPASVWRSWCRRHEAGNFPYGEFFLAWGALHALDQTMELDVICVDKQEDSRIVDWAPVGNEDQNRARWELIKADLRPLYKLPIIYRHYGPGV